MFKFGSGFEVPGSAFGGKFGHVVALEPWQILHTLRGGSRIQALCGGGIARALRQPVGVRRFTDLRAWQACYAYKNAVYRLCADGPLSTDWSRRRQIEDAVAGPPGHIAEGFGRFNPADFGRFLVLARSSLMESQNHLRDAVDKGYITDDVRRDHDRLAEAALEEVTGLMEYLQSPEALRNARRARERRIASRSERRTLNPKPRTKNRT